MNTISRLTTIPNIEHATFRPAKKPAVQLNVDHGSTYVSVSIPNLMGSGPDWFLPFTPTEARAIANKLFEYAASVEALQHRQ